VAETFASLRAQGIVEALGCSAYGGDMGAVERVVDSGAFDCLQVHYSLLNSTAWESPRGGGEARDYRRVGARAARAGMGVIALRVLEAGLLAGRTPPKRPALEKERAAARARLAALTPLLGEAPLAQTALRFALSQPEVATVLVGFSDVTQVEDAVAAATLGPLPAALLARVDSA